MIIVPTGEVEMRASTVPMAKLLVVTLLVSVLAAMLLAALPDFEPDVRAMDQRILLFWILYTAPICIAQVTVFLVVRWLVRK